MSLGTELLSRVVGYSIEGGDFATSSPNLPQRIAVLAEANSANQSGLDTTGKQITSAKQAGALYGYGSPIHRIISLLFPVSGSGIGGIPVVVYPQEEAAGATTKTVTITASGVATGNGTHTLVIAGRRGLDGVFYDININTGDDAAAIAAKIEDAVNAVLGAPVIAAADPYLCELESKWAGATADFSVTVDTNGNSLGITYTPATTQAASGTPTIADALAQFGNQWVTLVVNSYGTVANTLTALEEFNGNPNTGSGRYSAAAFKPLVALTGSVADDPTTITDARLNECTIAICPAPGSAAFQFEAAANVALLQARKAQDTPHLDIIGMDYPDMPVPASIGSMASYTNRDAFVKKGCSTVDLVAGKYQVQDFVTTYHPVGETPPQFRYVRDVFVDLNVAFGYAIIVAQNVAGKAIAADRDTVAVNNVIKPKDFKALIYNYYDDLAARALITEVDFSQAGTTVVISTTNPNRFNVRLRYKRSGIARIVDTIAQAGFSFGTL